MPSAISISTISAAVTTPYGGVNIATNVFVTGNVGIGTTTPSGKLEVGSGKFIVKEDGSVGVGTTNPGAPFTVGNNAFQVNTSGNIIKLNNVSYSWPGSQGGANTVLTNASGDGTLTWATGGGGGGGSYISAGDSNVTVTDAGDGYITFTEDASEIMRVSGSSVTMTNNVTIGAITAGEPGYTGNLQNNGGGVWNKRRTITITAGADALPADYTHRIYLDGTTSPTASAIFNSPCLSNGDDFRIEYWNGGSWIELDRHIITFTSSAIDVKFKLQVGLNAYANSGTAYRIVYNNPSAGAGKNNRDNIYLFWDDFSSGNLSKWSTTNGATIYNDAGNNRVQVTSADPNLLKNMDVSCNVALSFTYIVRTYSSHATGGIRFTQDANNYHRGRYNDYSWEPNYFWAFFGMNQGASIDWVGRVDYSKSLKTLNVPYTFTFARANNIIRIFDFDGTQKDSYDLGVGAPTTNLTSFNLESEENGTTLYDDVYLRPFVASDASITVSVGNETDIGGSANQGTGSIVVNAGGIGTALLVNHGGTGKIIDLQDNSISKFTVLDGGNVGIGTSSPTSKLQVTGLPEYVDNNAAIIGGLTIGAFYRTGDTLKVVH